MNGMNKVIMIGRLGREPDVRLSRESGTMWCSFTLATHRRVRVDDGWNEHTDWHRVKCFGGLAEHCGTYLSKGSLVAIDGAVHSDQWSTEDGEKKYATSIVADSITFLDPVQRNIEASARVES